MDPKPITDKSARRPGFGLPVIRPRSKIGVVKARWCDHMIFLPGIVSRSAQVIAGLLVFLWRVDSVGRDRDPC